MRFMARYTLPFERPAAYLGVPWQENAMTQLHRPASLCRLGRSAGLAAGLSLSAGLAAGLSACLAFAPLARADAAASSRPSRVERAASASAGRPAVDPALLADLPWREVGPYRGG